VERIDVETAAEMHAAVMAHIETADIFIGVAAVADYRPAQVAPGKLKKGAPRLGLELVRNPDILAEVAAREGAPFTVGFAAETEDVVAYARGKLQAKGVDMIAANHVGPCHGFDSDENALHVLWADGEQQLARTAKTRLARQLVAIIAAQFATIGRPGQVIRLHGKDSA
jgi:phosphopantothenoylcysteine decarboxylase/phosphopantothenate--cysteine ligase